MESRKIGDGFFRPTITPHLIPLISAFIKSSKEGGRRRRVETRERESGRESASLIKAKQAANRSLFLPLPPSPRIFAQEIITPPPLRIILRGVGLLERHIEWKEEFALAGTRFVGFWIGAPCKIHPFAFLCKITEEEEEEEGNREWKFTLSSSREEEGKGKLIFDVWRKFDSRDRNFLKNNSPSLSRVPLAKHIVLFLFLFFFFSFRASFRIFRVFLLTFFI